eukprot:jgi/Chlat1/886/Chrsp107S01330
MWKAAAAVAAALPRSKEVVSEDAVRQFEQDGAICLRNAISQDWIERLRSAAEANLRNPGPLCDEHAAKQSGGRFHDDQFLWRRHDAFERYVFDSPAPAIAQRMMRSSTLNIFYDQLLVKEPGTTAPTPWHNDMSYWQLTGNQIISLWLALDHVRKETMVTYVKGSHHWNLFHRVTRFDGDQSRYAASQDLPPPPDINNMQGVELLSWDVAPGDIVVHHALTVHGAAGNSSKSNRRRGYATRWTGDDVRYSLKEGTMHYPWVAAGLDPKLAHGSKLTCKLFPQIKLE